MHGDARAREVRRDEFCSDRRVSSTPRRDRAVPDAGTKWIAPWSVRGMADPLRFPHLAGPFAIAGGVAGWLSAGMLSSQSILLLPRSMQPATAFWAAVVAAIAGVIVRRLCVGRHYRYDLDAPDPNARPATDRAFHHVAAVLATGTVTGALIGGWFALDRVPIGAGGGLLCATASVPVVLAVVAAARRAQRARLGTLVASSDRRAVWGILATALAPTTLEALPDWWSVPPLGAVAIALGACGVVAVVLADDARAFRRAHAILEGLQAHDDSTPAPDEVAPIDLGLGDDLGAHLARAGTAYRDRARAIDLVRGDPARVRAAMARARRRGAIAAALVVATLILHLVAARVALG